MQLYVKAALHPFVIGFSLVLMGGLLFAFAVDPDPVGGEDYTSMLSAIQTGKIGFFFVAMIGNLKMHQNKFYASCCCGKILYTAAPIITAFALVLLYDIVFAIAAAAGLGSAGLADMLVVDSGSSALVIIGAAGYGKKRMGWSFTIPYVLFIATPAIVSKSGILDGMLGQPVGVSTVIAVGVYAVSVIFSLLIVNAWWKKGDKFSMPNKFVTNTMGGH